MPNYEIYFGDIHAILDGVGRGNGISVPVDSTDYFVQRTNTKYHIFRDGRSVGHLIFAIDSDGILSMGGLSVEEGHYRKCGVSNLLVMLALAFGVRGGANTVTLSEDVTQMAYRFWGHVGLRFLVKSTMADTLSRFELYQGELAAGLNLARSPHTLLLNTDRPVGVVAVPQKKQEGKRKMSL